MYKETAGVGVFTYSDAIPPFTIPTGPFFPLLNPPCSYLRTPNHLLLSFDALYSPSQPTHHFAQSAFGTFPSLANWMSTPALFLRHR